MLMDKLKRLFTRQEIPKDARDLIREAQDPRDVLRGLDELITRNEMEVNNITREMKALEEVEAGEISRVRSGELPDRSKNNVLRRITRLRKQMDNLEERQRIYNRNINLQIDLVGRVQALEAMDLRGVDEERIDSILAEYEQELSDYQSVLETQEIATGDLVGMLDDTTELGALEASILGEEPAEKKRAAPAPERASGEAAGTPPAAEAERPASSSDSDPEAPRRKEAEW